MLLIFPDGRLLSRRWWAVVAMALVGYFLIFLGVYMPGDDAHVGWPVGLWLSLAALLASGVSVVLRWRRSKDRERQQLKWLVYVVALVVVAGLAGLAGGYVWEHAYVPAVLLVTTGVGLGIPVAIGVAVLRYRLYDIDLLINRTLVYGALTAILVGIYFGGVAATQAVLQAFTVQEKPPQIVVVASTLVIAALFGPLRRRVQALVDRRFYRRKYDAAKTLAAFSTRLRDKTDLEALNDELVGVVRETMQPTHVGLWLRSPTEAGRAGQSSG
jgi:hypothetical protein